MHANEAEVIRPSLGHLNGQNGGKISVLGIQALCALPFHQ